MNKNILAAAVLAAVSVVLGFIFIFIPNVEAFTAALFISGFVLNPLLGVITAIFATLIYSGVNPYGSGFAYPNLMLMQIIGFTLVGLCGGLVRRFLYTKNILVNSLIIGTFGFLLTVIYDILTTLSYFLIAPDVTWGKVLAMFTSGSFFYATHVFSNTLIFLFVVPIILERLLRSLPNYLK